MGTRCDEDCTPFCSECDGYNGWKNRATWSVALWINNNEQCYAHALAFMAYDRKLADLGFPIKANVYQRFVYMMGLDQTPDGYSYNDETLDIKALDKMMQEL